MGCLVSRTTQLERLSGESLTVKPHLSNRTTTILVSRNTKDRHLWKVCKDRAPVLRQMFINNYRVKRLGGYPHILSPETLIKLNETKVAVCMKYMDMDLFQYVRTRFDFNRVWEGLREVVKGIRWMHSKGLAHRDIKPENIVMDAQHFYLIDFDFTSPLDEYVRCGTPTYIVPAASSQAWTCTNRERSLRHDVYAFGKTVLFVFCAAASLKMISPYAVLFEFYNGDHTHFDIANPFETDLAAWFDLAVRCCQTKTPDAIPLAMPDSAADTTAAKDVSTRIAPAQVVDADETVA